MSGQYYQQPPPQEQPYPPQGQIYSQEKKGLENFFIAKDKLGLFLFLCAGMILIGFLLLNLSMSGLIEADADSADLIRALNFLGMMAVDAGVIILVALIMVAGIYRDDLPEKTRNWMILVSGIVLVVILTVYMQRALMVTMTRFYW